MNKRIEKFLQFNGESICIIDNEKQYWIAIKPICQTLNVDFNRQFQNIRKDPILKEVISLQSIIAADNKQRNMVCLPEFFIYVWILSIRSTSAELLIYKNECYQLLYLHFHGSILKSKLN